MHALAREFNLSETIFVLPPTTTEATYRVRIFTPGREIPFAGHPSVGAAVSLQRAGWFPAGTVVQECGAGLLPIVVEPTGLATLTGGTPTVGAELDAGPLLAAVGLGPDDFTGPAPRVAGCGLDYPYLSVAPAAVRRAACDPAALRTAGFDKVEIFAWDAATSTAHARMFAPELGVPEDPATGSAALGTGIWLAAEGLAADGVTEYRLAQGAAVGRPSELAGRVVVAGGELTEVSVAGAVRPIASGTVRLPR
jgi:trans-2,3-dihydro-3-hydroxyanthranilate isomerase